ncbi:MAG: UDP-N-acetylglucosamine--N-acetylmuramyl-(pentapeptide) pyrophosphoryl-undecaprenol N-acetylglucosamine transferase [Candidatus Pacebacteria bacterium]|jgi:UDP-N-acetylglucosamine--N-acetylmuramyl-(pentapeptide) pyrophosphoryl-undecaprenol N-acetylglucosamine transferase|nr:UDP-N-acetylglucosamine--N-acetylmuramyl-(pentapeptide) pyrophosphoryl-undecaprenol N-acetylglucosamine transferase [Candidatus Paceibacterota bacterium]MDD4994441.1 UDP-N-acetylglucosamine--N-acetylmuramyl-(pentapeptide) pyrophosphoryl-undecaprenol N-acetylglucosamine transferase [Candidatus Paceibacterota bacterium]MDD5535154.1 UDP-N-acetylglucosamine--N-acetylmuramyl-(pentapeptide) pyrophosphoryl-undecaprenol N-acetylglucosamine transferase [Candidatus Paceibacterota bacterium]
MDISFLKSRSFSRTIRLVLTGGGSGGHTFPLIAVAREFKKIAQEKNFLYEIIYIGPNDFTLPYILKEEGITIRKITTGKLNRQGDSNGRLSGFINFFVNLFKTLGGIFQSLYYLFILMPDAIFSKGGYGAFPVIFWGIIFFIPTYTHESDAVPGLVNHLVGKFCRKIFISFDYTKKYFPLNKSLLTGNPIRLDLFSGEGESYNSQNIKELLKLSSDRPVITVIGGSQGSSHINDFILDILPRVINKAEIIHQTGKDNYQKVVREATVVFQEIIRDKEFEKYYHPVPFFEETKTPNISSLKDIYLVSDLIIARAGSGLIFEIAASKKPSILIPLPWASRGHQKRNAYEYARNGAAIVVEENNLKTNIFSDLILQVLFDEKKKKAMSSAAFQFAKLNAAQDIAKEIVNQL